MNNMKKKLFFAALALVAMAGCTSDENVTVVSPPEPVIEESEPVISFNMGSRTATRADHFGKDAATLLNNKFIVSAFKGNGTAMNVTMPDYIVTYTDNSAGKTESNTSDWEYVGITAEAPSSIVGNKQTIKYWDYSQDQYDFVAYSTGKNTEVITDGVPSETNVKVTAIDPGSYGPTYAFSGSKEPLSKCYIADMVTAYKDAAVDPQHKYQDVVTFSFRNLASKVRVALYETVPGYSVKDVKFYTSHGQAISSATETDATLFTIGGENKKDYFFSRGKMIVTFPTIGSGNVEKTDYNKAHVAFTPGDEGKSTTQAYGTLNYSVEDASEEAGDYYLGRNLPNATYAGAEGDHYYTTVLPNEEGTVLELRIDYTLLATDGSGETINIYGATAYVPAIYAAWKPNYAYTYIFKISDNTNGWTDPTGAEPSGLYPITFDAVVVDSEEYTQSTITTVATPSITTYQKGHDVNKDEYDTSKGDIYVMVMDNTATPAAPKADIGTYGKLYVLTKGSDSKADMTEANVMDALNIRSTGDEDTGVTGLNGLTLTRENLYYADVIPGVDGNDVTVTPEHSAVRFTPASGTTYAFCYKVSTGTPKTVFLAETLYTRPSDWTQSNLWYTDPEGEHEAQSFVEGAVYYKKRYTNNNDVWAVKIIKVE